MLPLQEDAILVLGLLAGAGEHLQGGDQRCDLQLQVDPLACAILKSWFGRI